MSDPFLGEIRLFAGGFAPRGWALCDGQLLAVSQYSALFSLFGTIYGGDGRTTFGLPGLRGRLPMHRGNGPGLTPRTLGARGGSETVTLNVNQIPSHTHAWNATQGAASSPSPQNVVLAKGASNVYAEDFSGVTLKADSAANTGGSQAHTNLMPAQCVNFIVALTGVYPSRS